MPTRPEEQQGQQGEKQTNCPTYGDLLRLTTKVIRDETRTAILQQHVEGCGRCQHVTGTMEGWVAEDAKIVKEIYALPLASLMEHAQQAARAGNASILSPIAERCGELLETEHRTMAIAVLSFIAENGCGVAVDRAEGLLKDLNLN